MLKKILTGVAVLVLAGAVGVYYMNYRNRALSPPGKVELTSGDLTVTIPYSRPSVRGRLIFGPKEQGALQPYGEYWRLGANESTEITFSRDVIFNGQQVKKGTYRTYAIPGPQEFEIILNTELGEWGYSEADHDFDILRTKVPVQKLDTPVEQYTITLEEITGGIQIIFTWSDTKFVVPVQ
jgi:hypothetical protein